MSYVFSEVPFTVQGATIINQTADDRVMKYDIPVDQQLDVQTGDFVGIYHQANEISRTMCYKPVQPEHSEWMVSDIKVRIISPVLSHICYCGLILTDSIHSFV